VSNLQPVKADIVYKQGEPYDRGGQWLIAIEHYKRAIELAPREDFYYLYLGRAYLEYASSIEDPAVRESLLRETERVLLQARELNPLNTDHSANLARMYRRWADLAGDENTKRTLLQKSSENYALATTLSPNNAILWNEWAMLDYYGMGDVEGYERALRRSLELDPDFDQTWLVCGDVNRHRGNVAEAIHCYEEALRLRPSNSDVWRALGDTYIAAQQWEKAIHALTRTLELQPKAQDAWNVLQVIARLYSQLGQQEQALLYARQALEVAPDEQRDALEGLVAQIQQIMEASQP
jgi:tetratricopeptide (TPR) repeat protein